MPSLAAIATIDFPYKVAQQEVKLCARSLFEASFPGIDKMMGAFDHTGIITRNFCKPLTYYQTPHTFREQNRDYIETTLKYSIQAIEQCLKNAGMDKNTITHLIFVSTTGLATPSMDALIINAMKLSQDTNRTPIFGLGCAGGVAAYTKAHQQALADPAAVILLVAAELCSLTFLHNDFSKSNFIGASLFADGIAACIITGDNIPGKGQQLNYIGSQSKLYYDTLDVMGWDFREDGFKVLFSQDIPNLIATHIRTDITHFLSSHKLELTDIRNFIFHPGGKKVLTAYEEALQIPDDFLHNTRNVMNANGNMSGPTVLYVLEQFIAQGPNDGYSLMLAMGPGFSSEMVLLQMNKK